MAYRGEDLDLRTSYARPAREGMRDPRDFGDDNYGANGAARRRPSGGQGRQDPILVDDTVLACCNHAYDVAQAHGAAEVRLEHLVHALTRVEAAADILEQRGIRENHLRRESASVIAGEIPVGLAHSQSAPRSSIEFEDVLRRATDHAAPRYAPAGVHDLLWVLLNYDREIPAIALLLRHAQDWQKWDWPNRRESARQTYVTERRSMPSYTDPMPRRERIIETASERIPERIVERVVETQQERSPERVVERVVERSPERLPERVVERVVERAPERERYERYVERAPERERVERVVVRETSELDSVHARLDQMDYILRQLNADMANDRRAIADMIRDIHRELSTRPSGGGDAGQLLDRFQGVEQIVDMRMSELAETTQSLAARLGTVEKSVTGNWSSLGERFKSLDNVLASAGPANVDLSSIETQLELQLEAIGTRMNRLEQLLAGRGDDGQRVISAVTERMRSLDESLGQIRSAVAQAPQGAQMASLLDERIGTIKRVVETLQGETVAAVVNPVERRLGVFDQRLAAIEGTLATQDLAEIHEAILKLGTNQQTLSENLDQWRLENGGDLGVLANRLAHVEENSAKPVAAIAQLTDEVHSLQRLALEEIDEERRGFKRWLFGTNDVFASSWRSETDEIRARLVKLKEERQARRG
jgi:uncharacterized protein YukE